jgi:hypothetical protein
MRAWVLGVLAMLVVGCAPHPYHVTSPGRFEGDLRLRWVGPEAFLVEPDPQRPFRFVRPGGQAIEPGAFVTDGGSLPRALWGLEGLSPWGYAPAFVVHDWLFQRYRCGLTPGGEAAFAESVAVMGEALRALMGDAPSAEELERYRAIMAAVAGPLGRYHWHRSPCRTFVDPW